MTTAEQEMFRTEVFRIREEKGVSLQEARKMALNAALTKAAQHATSVNGLAYVVKGLIDYILPKENP